MVEDGVLRDTVTPDEVFTLHQGNSRNLGEYVRKYFSDRSLESGVLDLTITSPPYADLKVKDYKSDANNQIGVEESYEGFLDNLRLVFKQVYDLTVPDGTLWVVVNTFKENGRVVRLPWDIVEECENLNGIEQCPECGSHLSSNKKRGGLWCTTCDEAVDTLAESWTLHDVIVWDKKRARPYSGQKTFRNVFEYILVFKKGGLNKLDFDRVRIADPGQFAQWWVDWPERYHPRGKVPENIWEMVTPSQGEWGSLTIDHPAPFPPALVERIVEFASKPDDIVFDPFAGTGMTIAQSSVMGRRALGIELSEEYCERFEQLQMEIQSLWDEREDSGETFEQQQDRLARVIWGLRQLVYARKMLLKLRQDLEAKTIDELGVNTIFVLGHTTDNGELTEKESVETDFNFVFDDHRLDENRQTTIQDMIEGYARQSPWQGFGLEPNLKVTSLAKFIHQAKAGDKWWSGSRLYLYHGAKHHEFLRTISFEEWSTRSSHPRDWREEYGIEEYAPIVSNISVQVNRDGDYPKLDVDPLGEPPEDMTGNGTDSLETSPKRTTLLDY